MEVPPTEKAIYWDGIFSLLPPESQKRLKDQAQLKKKLSQKINLYLQRKEEGIEIPTSNLEKNISSKGIQIISLSTFQNVLVLIFLVFFFVGLDNVLTKKFPSYDIRKKKFAQTLETWWNNFKNNMPRI